MQSVGRLIGNAVPPVFGAAVGRALMTSISQPSGAPARQTLGASEAKK